MKEMVSQLKVALEAKAYYPALFICLALPDVCGALESEDGKATGQKYKTWFNTYVRERYRCQWADIGPFYIEGEQAYILRCSLLHQGSFTSRNDQKYRRIIFQESTGPNNIVHLDIVQDDDQDKGVLMLDAKTFCQDVMDGVEVWLKAVHPRSNYQTNYAHTIKRYPNGFPPYVHGIPQIA